MDGRDSGSDGFGKFFPWGLDLQALEEQATRDVAPTVAAAAPTLTPTTTPATEVLWPTGSWQSPEVPGTRGRWIQETLRTTGFLSASRCPHSQRVSRFCYVLAGELGMDEMGCALVGGAALLHDLGKTFLPAQHLVSADALTAEGRRLMECHTVLGAALLSDLQGPFFLLARQVALCHHEHWDGSGYPGRLAGEEIPLAARIVAVADTYDALRSERPYKRPYSHHRACEVLLDGDGRTLPGHFDPQVLSAFEAVRGDFAGIFTEAGRTFA